MPRREGDAAPRAGHGFVRLSTGTRFVLTAVGLTTLGIASVRLAAGATSGSAEKLRGRARMAATTSDDGSVPNGAGGGTAAAPTNDLCANAATVTDGSTPFSTIDANTDGPIEGANCSFSGYNKVESDIWYEYRSTCAGDVTVSLCGSDYDTKLAVYDICDRCPPGQAAMVCNEDALGACGTRSQVKFSTQQNACYTIRIGGWLGAQGTGTMAISCQIPTGACCSGPDCLGTMTQASCAAAAGTWHEDRDCASFTCPVPPPANDACTAAEEVFSGVPVSRTNAGSTGSDISSCGFEDAKDVWHKWRADCTGPATFTLCGSSFDTTLAVYDSCGGTELACNDDGTTCAPASRVDVNVVSGQTYWVRVAGFRGVVGNYQLTAEACSQEPRACCGGQNNGACFNLSPAQCLGFGATPQARGTVCLTDANGNGINDACEAPPDPWTWLDANGSAADGYLPDFDQNQDFDNADGDGNGATGVEPFHGGPAAVADAILWLAAKYPAAGVVAPGVTPPALIDDLAARTATNGATLSPNAHPVPYRGTWLDDLVIGLRSYFNDAIGPGLLSIEVVNQPLFAEVSGAVVGSSNVVLRLGFHRVEGVDTIPGTGFVVRWRRTGGQYVSVAGADVKNERLAWSDPDADEAEQGAPGEVRGGEHNHDGDANPNTSVPFRDASYDHTAHNVVALASHDAYDALPSFGPIGEFVIAQAGDALAYGQIEEGFHQEDARGTQPLAETFVTLAFLAENGFANPAVGQVYTVVEDALIISPTGSTACCQTNGSCLNVSPIACLNQGGTPKPAGLVCLGDGNANTTDDICEPCPAATIALVTPPDGTVDARQPNAPGALLPRLGIGSPDESVTVTLDPPITGGTRCFVLCETDSDPVLGGNGITAVADDGGGSYTLTLDHAIAPGAVTTIEYESDAGGPVILTAHPSNADAGPAASEDDLVELADCCLVGGCAPAWGSYSCDIDRSGGSAPSDLLRAIDLLNGADGYEVWLGTALPDIAPCP